MERKKTKYGTFIGSDLRKEKREFSIAEWQGSIKTEQDRQAQGTQSIQCTPSSVHNRKKHEHTEVHTCTHVILK